MKSIAHLFWQKRHQGVGNTIMDKSAKPIFDSMFHFISQDTPDKYKDGIDITNEGGSDAVPLNQTIQTMWRRILVNMPFLLRSRGTMQGVRALMNTLGVESDSVFRFREYGGAPTMQISNVRKKKRRLSGFLDFNKLTSMKGPELWAYRHEPGAPDPDAAPVAASIDGQFGDIIISTPATPPIKTLYTSGSWAWEGRYTLLPTETTASLFRIESQASGGADVDTFVN